MNYNYHTHTYRCGHAIGSDEEYVQRAIHCGIKYMGFSEHAPLMCDDGFESDYRLPMAMAKSYVDDISIALKEKYADKIDIKIGFEIEYYPDEFNKMLKNVIDLGAEYLILGQHFLGNEHFGCAHTMCTTDDGEQLKKYVSLVVSAIKSGVFTYVAHPDILNFIGCEQQYKMEMKKICVASAQCNIPLEINFLGIDEKRNYPNKLFWQLVGEVGSPVTFGFDAHSPDRAFDDNSLKVAEKIVDMYNLKYIGKPQIMPLYLNERK